MRKAWLACAVVCAILAVGLLAAVMPNVTPSIGAAYQKIATVEFGNATCNGFYCGGDFLSSPAFMMLAITVLFGAFGFIILVAQAIREGRQ